MISTNVSNDQITVRFELNERRFFNSPREINEELVAKEFINSIVQALEANCTHVVVPTCDIEVSTSTKTTKAKTKTRERSWLYKAWGGKNNG